MHQRKDLDRDLGDVVPKDPKDQMDPKDVDRDLDRQDLVLLRHLRLRL